jgi:hypothetical protein
MSVAHPEAILQRGHVKPQVLAAAQALQRAGWRVTSIYRPTGVSHPYGIALDTAPMVFVQGGFGYNTAAAVFKVVKAAVPGTCWLANAELDHIHVQMFPFDALGRNTNTGTVIRKILGVTT